MKDDVKRGESSGSVTITLSSGNPARPTVVSRKITTDNKSEWKLNGEWRAQRPRLWARVPSRMRRKLSKP